MLVVMDINWLPVVGWEGYYDVSNTGEVRSVQRVIVNSLGKSRTLKSKILRPSTGRWGHKRVNLHRSDGSKPSTRTVHTLVLEAFHGPRPPGYFGCHVNGDPQDNTSGNLYWGTPSENMYDKAKHGTDAFRNRTHCPRGHKLVEPNLKKEKLEHGWRGCKACHQASSDRFNGSVLSFDQLADMRYFMVMTNQVFKHSERKAEETNMYKLSLKWKAGH